MITTFMGPPGTIDPTPLGVSGDVPRYSHVVVSGSRSKPEASRHSDGREPHLSVDVREVYGINRTLRPPSRGDLADEGQVLLYEPGSLWGQLHRALLLVVLDEPLPVGLAENVSPV